ncbi:hypothetical protein F0P96_02845 [Hymenobacter busanensis]|uniref:Uncharacterized protein n=1 Tax=Hymenobacter busanensis TaxID=2607656 RepID=A0A7L4ZU50_9BACT|nr:hypothetical protein [Hymenobacter busanensis]KAA9339567.1 hypothetical protein F0P96_02845 [Hymenobacter busanensis]QHJ06678.1 hypothetical protein GUY19_04910 [Hymenobacter busanensis]
MTAGVTPAFTTVSVWHLLNTIAAGVALGLMLSPFLYELAVANGIVAPAEAVRSSCGDTPAEWAAVRVGIIWGLVTGVALVAGQVVRRQRWVVPDVVLDVVALFLSLTLLKYGFVKVLGTQFPRLWANLDTPPAELTPMRVAWQFFGYSAAYQQFLGWGEVLPGVLLLFRRTRTLGAFIAAVVMLNVFLVNIFFDVCVKIGSGSYLFFALLLLSQDADRMWQFFVAHRPTALRTLPATAARFGKRGRVLYRGLGVLLTLGVIGLTAQDLQGIREYAASQKSVFPYTGVWETIQAARWTDGRWQPLAPADSAYPTRAYFQAAQAVLRNAARRDRFVTELDSARPDEALLMVARNESNDFAEPRRWVYHAVQPDSLRLLGRWRQDSLKLSLRLNRNLMK